MFHSPALPFFLPLATTVKHWHPISWTPTRSPTVGFKFNRLSLHVPSISSVIIKENMTKAGITPTTLVEEPGATDSSRQLDGKPFHITLVYTKWYEHVVQPLVDACKKELLEKGVESDNICTVQVPGAFELPFAAKRIIKTRQVDAVIAIGCMIKGATMAYEFVSETVTLSLMKLNIKTDIPVIFGVLTAMDEAEAKNCAGIGKEKTCNHGVEWAQSALELAQLRKKTAEKIQARCNCKCHCKDDCSCSCHCTHCKCRTCTCGSSCSCQHCVGHEHEQETKQQKEACTLCGNKSCQGACKSGKTSSGTCSSCGDKSCQGTSCKGSKTCTSCGDKSCQGTCSSSSRAREKQEQHREEVYSEERQRQGHLKP